MREISMRIDTTFITAAVTDAVIKQGSVLNNVSFSVDTRALQPGDIFIALPGNRCDGHDFLAQALHKQASGFIIAQEKQEMLNRLDQKALKDKLIVIVPDTMQALTNLACEWRKKITVPLVAITGSVGKTSTKNMLGALLGHSGRQVFVSYGNQNTVIGVALNILRLNRSHEVGIFEIGINQRGEMGSIIAILKPETALITAIGHCHMEGLGSLTDIAAEKREIFKYLKEDHIGFINGDQPLLTNVAYPHPVIKFGLKTSNQIQARKITTDGFTTNFVLKLYKEKFPVTLSGFHQGLVLNSLAAAAVAHHLGVPASTIVQAIQKPVVTPGRFEKKALKEFPGFVISDCYNANPESMKAALLAFQKVETKAQKIAILGDMLELGADSPFWHRQLGRFLRKVPSLKRVILVGSLVQWTQKCVPTSLPVELVPTWQEALSLIKPYLAEQSAVLVKGSHGVGLYHVVDQLADKATPSEL